MLDARPGGYHRRDGGLPVCVDRGMVLRHLGRKVFDRGAHRDDSVVCGFHCAALRGEEIPQVDLGLIRKHWAEAQGFTRKPHVPLVLVGKFKQTSGGALRLYVQPLTEVTTSGLRVRDWVGRAVFCYERAGVTSGPLFRTLAKNGTPRRSTGCDLNSLFHDVLRRAQARFPDIIGKSVKVEDEYSIRRSLRRGATTHAMNRGIPEEVVEANNRWRRHLHSRGVLPSMSMLERYSDAKASADLLVRFSEGL